MNRKRKLVLLGTVLVLCGLAIELFLQKALKPSASIRFTKATLENGQLDIAYSYSHSSGTSLSETEFSNGKVTGGGSDEGESLLWFPNTGSDSMETDLRPDLDPSSKPILLVQTGKTYKIDFNTRLEVYSFTNKSGGVCKYEFALKPVKR